MSNLAMSVVFGVQLICDQCRNPVIKDGDGYLCLGCRLRGRFNYEEANRHFARRYNTPRERPNSPETPQDSRTA